VLQFVVNQVANPEAFLARVKYLYEHKSEKSHEEIAIKDGRIIDRYSAPMVGTDGKYYGRVWYFRDVTAKKRSEQMILESEEKFRGLVEQSLAGIALLEGDRFSYVNRKFADIFDYSVTEIKLLRTADIVVDKDVPIVTEIVRRHLTDEAGGREFTFRGLRKDGVVVNIEGRGTRITFGGKDALMVIILDITERIRAERAVKKLQAQLREMAIRDPLTDLYNRRYLDETIGRELIRAERERSPLSVVMVDIDHFKGINDSRGHSAGDEVLKAFGKIIKHHARGSDIVCRYGGEEFLLVFPGMEKAIALARAEQLRAEFANTSVQCGNSAIHATASFGVASFPEDGRDAARLIAAADKALYAAKEAGRNSVRVAA
jgi:diguanylate cyclase (GGDEF)-like protein/PAS domain S-box-containing protein